MFNVLRARLQQGYHTSAYPKVSPTLPDRFRGLPRIAKSECAASCESCREKCPVGAIRKTSDGPVIDLGTCLFCGACKEACPSHRIDFTADHALAARRREDLVVNASSPATKAQALDKSLLKIFGRSLKLRQVSAGGCNACEADTNVLNTLVFDLARFGIQFVASPRHADGLLVTGPVTKNMEVALRKTYEATPSPKIVIAAGACAISGGMFAKHEETAGGVDTILPVDLYIPGCPPSPWTILDGLLRLTGKL